jgi:hypothetical protein
MTLEAKNDGPMGNDIMVEVRQVGVDVVEIEVTEAHVYEGLDFGISANSVSTMLDASEHGILHHTAVTEPTTDLPVGGPVQESTIKPGSWALKKGNTSLAVLEPRGAGWDEGTMTVLVEDVGPTATTFTLKVSWSSTVTVTANTLTANALARLKFAVSVKSPPPPAQRRLPMPGRVALQGGAAGVPSTDPKKAQITLLADE